MPRPRHHPPHLETRRSGHYWRRRLPRSLQCTHPASSNASVPTSSKKIFLCFSLKTHVSVDAKMLARRLTEMSDLVFAASAETVMAIAPDVQTRMLESLARFEIAAFERARAIAGPRSLDAAAIELRREEALQDTLRRAIHLGDREIARRPLRHVAARLGIESAEQDEDWAALAYEATKVLLDVSRERARRQQGLYDHPTPYFRRALDAGEPIGTALSATGQQSVVAPAGLASDAPHDDAPPAPAPAPVPASMLTQPRDDHSVDVRPAKPAQMHGAAVRPPSPGTSETSLQPVTAAPLVVPAHLELPTGFDERSWQEARVAARPPRVLVDRKLLSEGSRAALEKERGIILPEAIELHYELIGLGYRAPFDAHQKRKPLNFEKRNASIADRLCEDHRSKRRLALDFWPAVLGDGPVDEIPVDDVNDALSMLWTVPKNHGRSEADRKKHNLLELIEMADAKEASRRRKVEAARARGASAQEIDRLRLQAEVKRLSVLTFVKHGRVMRAVGEMLWDMQLIDHNPFAICSWTKDEVDDLQRGEGCHARTAWDDRQGKLFGSRIYREPLKDVGDPLFWAPLVARHQGLRMEECLQLGPDDFGSDKGIPTLRIRKTIINGVKTLSSERTLPVHPQLVELGLLELVELRRTEGHIRLFPHLTRGAQKGTFSANFSKCFGYYRRTNECYWPGLDFHALRTTFHNDLLSDDKSDALRCRLMGHAPRDEGAASYGQSLGIEALAERLRSVVVDVSMIRKPFEDHPSVDRKSSQRLGLRLVS